MDETLIHYTDVEIHQQELCVLSEVNLQLHKGSSFIWWVKWAPARPACSKPSMASSM